MASFSSIVTVNNFQHRLLPETTSTFFEFQGKPRIRLISSFTVATSTMHGGLHHATPLYWLFFYLWQWVFVGEQPQLAILAAITPWKRFVFYVKPLTVASTTFDHRSGHTKLKLKIAVMSFVTVLTISNFNVCSSSYELSKFQSFRRNILKSHVSGCSIMN